MNKLFIFDCFGVIFSPISLRFFKQHFANDVYLKKHEEIMQGVDLGEKSFDDVMNDLSKQLAIPKDKIKQTWINMCEINYELLDKILELRSFGKTALLSNAPSGLIETIFLKNHLKIERYFDLVLISADYHMMKPDPKFYQLCIDKFDEKFGLLTLCDDRMFNLKNVDECNITPILMTTNKEVIPILDELKLR